MKRTLFALAATLLLLSTAAQAKTVDNLGIAIASCVVNNNGSDVTNGVNVVYYSSHEVAVAEVDFLVGYKGHRYVLKDVGSFTQGAKINHNLTNALVGQPWSGPNVNLCTPQKVVLANGQVETR
jgi:hypothetical protein